MKATPFRLSGLLLLLSLLLGCQQDTQQADGNKPLKKPKNEHLVEALAAAPQSISSRHEYTGTLSYRRFVHIHNQEEGQIANLPWYEGDKVKAGQLLVALDDTLLRAQLDKARAASKQAHLDLQRIQRLAKVKATSEDDLARARTAREVAEAEETVLSTRLSYSRIDAPFDGIVTERLMEPGDIAPKHSHLLTLADPASLIIEVLVSERLLAQLDDKAEVEIRIDALGGPMFHGVISRRHPQLDPVTHQGKLEITLDPLPAGAAAGQFARLTLSTAVQPRLMIPYSSLQRDADGEFVFVIDAEGKAQRMAIKSGQRIENQVSVEHGLQGGEQVVSRGFLGLSPGMRVKILTP